MGGREVGVSNPKGLAGGGGFKPGFSFSVLLALGPDDSLLLGWGAVL